MIGCVASDDLMSRLRELVQEDPPDWLESAQSQETGPLEAARERIVHLEIAVAHQRVIGQATGLVMERFSVDADTAFAVLRRISNERNRKVYDIAMELTRTGHAEGL